VQIKVHQLGLTCYTDVLQAMQKFTNERTGSTEDEIWVTEHYPVFTQGQAGRPEHVLLPGDIPVIQSDRGGQVTYHGPGQLVIYLLINIKRKKLFVRDLVCAIEQSVIEVLRSFDVKSANRDDAPGVYVDGAKIAALGLRIRRMCSYHGLSFNVDMELEPFQRINPCGMENLPVTQLRDQIPEPARAQVALDMDSISRLVLQQLLQRLDYSG